ncbi:MAG TPA: hypothetical protein VIQ02_12160, partial [Jiangellaceae bacterium]
MNRYDLPVIRGPHDVPELRQWLIRHWRPGGPLSVLDEHRFMTRNLPAAKLWWVEAETCDLLADAAPTLPTDVTLNMDDVPTPCGLAVFAHDFIGTDADPAADGRQVYVSALLWAPSNLPEVVGQPSTGISIAMFSRLVMDDGLTKQQMQWAIPDMVALDDQLQQRRQLPPTENEAFDVHGHLFAFVGRTDWLEGWTADRCIPDNPHGLDPRTVASMAEDRRLLASLWLLAKTPFVDTTTTRPSRVVARRSERKGLDPTVRVLRLGGPGTRHPSTVGTTTTINRKHSWMRSAHWRWQPYG